MLSFMQRDIMIRLATRGSSTLIFKHLETQTGSANASDTLLYVAACFRTQRGQVPIVTACE